MLTRFAPSPTGLLHLGHAYAAEQAFNLGPCLLRIEDIDQTRSKSELTQAIYDDLRWLGFDWPKPVRVQNEHRSAYQAVIDTLDERGFLYRDFTTRTGREDRSQPPNIKLSVSRAISALGKDKLGFLEKNKLVSVDLAKFDDPTVVRRDIGTSYHIAVTHDDALQGMTHVCRGADLYRETGYHVLIQTLMNWPVPHYHHHGLVMETPDKKMSKRRGSRTIRALREAGYAPEAVRKMAREAASDRVLNLS